MIGIKFARRIILAVLTVVAATTAFASPPASTSAPTVESAANATGVSVAPSSGVVRAADSIVQCWYGSDQTGEAWIDSCLFRRASNGAHYVDLYVWDALPGNGRCARGAVEWRHDNGNNYYDPPSGQTNCTASWVGQVYGARNQTLYQWVQPAVWIQGNNADYLTPRHYF